MVTVDMEAMDMVVMDLDLEDIEESVDTDIMAMERGLLRPKLMLNQDISPEDMVTVDMEAMDMVVMDLDLEDIEELVDTDIMAMERDLLRLNQVTFQEDTVLEVTEVMDWDMEDITAMVDLEDIMVNFLEAKVSAEENVSHLNKKLE